MLNIEVLAVQSLSRLFLTPNVDLKLLDIYEQYKFYNVAYVTQAFEQEFPRGSYVVNTLKFCNGICRVKCTENSLLYKEENHELSKRSTC